MRYFLIHEMCFKLEEKYKHKQKQNRNMNFNFFRKLKQNKIRSKREDITLVEWETENVL
jgi:hypothetical protein